MDSTNEGDLLDIAARLRQLLFDGGASLVDKVNTSKLRLQFTLETSYVPEKFSGLVVSEGAAEQAGPRTQIVCLSRKAFSAFPMLYIAPKWLTVREIVSFAANVAGGVHHDSKPRDQFKGIDEMSKQLFLGGLPSGLTQLRPIARITMSSLLPLIEDVRYRIDQR